MKSKQIDLLCVDVTDFIGPLRAALFFLDFPFRVQYLQRILCDTCVKEGVYFGVE